MVTNSEFSFEDWLHQRLKVGWNVVRVVLVDTGILCLLHLPLVNVTIRVPNDTRPKHVREVVALDYGDHLRTELLDTDIHCLL